MLTDINLYINDRQKFYDEIREANLLDEDERNKKVKEINEKFRDKIRKYLPTCLNVVNTNYGCQFSLYKVGKDFDSSFKVIETNVKKSRAEVESELANYRNSIDFNSLSETVKNELNLATEILTTYVDDLGNVDVNKMEYLAKATAKTSSIINTVPRMSQQSLEQDNTSMNMQYNPYANTPVNLTEEFEAPVNNQFDNNNLVSSSTDMNANPSSENGDSLDNTNFSMDIFYGNGQ